MALGAGAVIMALGVSARAGEATPPGGQTAGTHSSGEVLGRLPLVFEPLDGQGAFLAMGTGAEYLLSPAGVTIRWADASPPGPSKAASGGPRDPLPNRQDTPNRPLPAQGQVHSIRLYFEGADARAVLAPLEELPGKVNVIAGSDPSRWRTGIPTYGKVRCQGLYPGIDLVFYGSGRDLEFDLIVKPGADPSAVRFALNSSTGEGIRLSDGNALLTSDKAGLRLVKPTVYQEVGGKRVPIAGEFRLHDDRSLGFRLGSYDARLPLVIDPVTQWGTYIGGSSSDQANAVAMDSSGFIYIPRARPTLPISPWWEGWGTWGGSRLMSSS